MDMLKASALATTTRDGAANVEGKAARFKATAFA